MASVDETASVPEFNEEVVYTFNKFLIDFVLLLKTTDRDIRSQLKHAYKSVNTKATSHISKMMTVLPLEDLGAFAEDSNDAFFERPGISDIELLDGLTIAAITAKTSPSTTRYYTYLFGVLCCLAVDESESQVSDKIGELLLLLKEAPLAEDSLAVEERITNIAQGNEDVAKMCRCVARQVRAPAAAEDSPTKGSPPDIKDALENTKIGLLAKEISEEIDLSNVDVSDPSKLLNFGDFANQNSFMGKVVSKVGTKIQSKIQTGELKHEDLIKEAMSLLTTLDLGKTMAGAGGGGGAAGGGPDLSAMFQGMASGGSGGGGGGADMGSMLQGMMSAFGGMAAGNSSSHSGSSARNRLRQQLQKRQQQ